MLISEWLLLAQSAFTESGIDSARLDALLLLEDATGHDRSWLLAHLEFTLSAEQLDTLAINLERRLQHEPLAYIRGFCEFYGRRFMVTPDVLVPRPESETIIEFVKQYAPNNACIADIGTGSGCLAITAALETAAVVCAVDIDEACLDVAKQNAVMQSASVEFIHGSLLEPFLQADASFTPTILVANLPYVPNNHQVNQAAQHEPALALFAGDDGLDVYRGLFAQATQLPKQPKVIITEALPFQHDALQAIAHTAHYQQLAQKDYVQLFSLMQ